MKPITISKSYRITIPLEIRKQFGLKSGQKTLNIVFVPSSIQEGRGMFKSINTDVQREEVDEER